MNDVSALSEALNRSRIPLAMAGERPVARFTQEDLSQLRKGDQQCGWPRMPILNGCQFLTKIG